MSRTIPYVRIYASIVTLLLLIVVTAFMPRSLSDVAMELASKAGGEDATVYSANYSERRFRQVRQGMSRDEVQQLLGAPVVAVQWRCSSRYLYVELADGMEAIRPSQDNEMELAQDCLRQASGPLSLHYTIQGDPRKNHRLRLIHLSESGVVDRIEANYDFD